mmetsp:Transcript_15348/g.22411  ORF Transcript_15348/g.22411 Transcript_15348/m.22411 type:complete len:80 (-) Transcript_15348:215-454(-)
MQKYDNCAPMKDQKMKMQAKKNIFDSDSSGVASRLVLSGSRGIGGVITNNIASTIDLFDLEENEEEDDESEYGEGEGSL